MTYSPSAAARVAAALSLVLAAACSSNKGSTMIKKEPFGQMPSGDAVDLYTLTNANGMEARIMTYGGTVVSLTAPDRSGKFADVVLGMDDAKSYTTQTAYFGALIGRYGNRIGGATFQLDGQTYNLPKNDNGVNTLHGGTEGFDKRMWTGSQVQTDDGQSLSLTYVSKDGEMGFPGTLTAKVVYSLTADNGLKIDYTATTDKDTVVNLTNHSYFNLSGPGSGDILQHQVMIDADKFTPVNSLLIPTGELKPVAGTPFDFKTATAIGARIENDDEQLKFGKGYDHNWVLNSGGGSLAKAAEVYDPASGRVLQVWTTQPGLQFYTGNFLDGTVHGKGGKVYGHRGGFCMETQHFPDSPNKPSFPSTELKPGETYKATTIYKFSAR